MITYVGNSLYESPAQVLVNTVNTQGVMGKVWLQSSNAFTRRCLNSTEICVNVERLISESFGFTKHLVNGFSTFLLKALAKSIKARIHRSRFKEVL
jgi:hypothetical protein